MMNNRILVLILSLLISSTQMVRVKKRENEVEQKTLSFPHEAADSPERCMSCYVGGHAGDQKGQIFGT
jgi:hypothetical protein